MNIFLSILFFVVTAWCVMAVFQKEPVLKKIFWPALIAKCLAGIALGMIYMFYYREGDTLEFYHQGVRLAALVEIDVSSYLNFLFRSEFVNGKSVLLTYGDQRAIFMVKIVSVFALVSFSNYWIMTCYVSIISFLGSWYLVRQIYSTFEAATPAAVIAFLFFPSVIFWSAGLIKETFAMAGLYFISGIFLRVWFRQSVRMPLLLVAFVAAYFLWNLKYYFAGIFLAVVAASLLYRFVSSQFENAFAGKRGLLGWFIFLTVFIVAITFLHPNFKSQRLLAVMVENYKAFQELSKPDGVILFNDLQPTLISMLVHSPKALLSGLFRPFIWEASNVFSLLIGIENLLLLALSLNAVRYVSAMLSSTVIVLLMAIVVYVMLLSIFITLSTPNFGTLARYRVGYLPFFVFLILLAPSVNIRLQNAFDKIAKV